MQLIKYFLIVISASFIITAAVTAVANKGLRHSSVDFYGKINADNDTSHHTNLLLVGSSRMLVHGNPQVMDSITGLNSYNYGLNAGSIRTWYNMMNNAIRHCKQAKAAVLNIDYKMFDTDSDPYKAAYYYPFENTGSFVTNDSGTTAFIHRVHFLDISLYDDYAKYAAIDGLLRPGRAIAGTYKGFNPHTEFGGYEPVPAGALKNNSIVCSENGFGLLDSCISLCRRNNVQLVFTLAPYFKEEHPAKYYPDFDKIINRVKAVAAAENVPFFDFTGMEIAAQKELFYNVNHLNSKGAFIYSCALADSLKKVLR